MSDSTPDTAHFLSLRVRDFHPLWSLVPQCSTRSRKLNAVLTPRCTHHGLGSSDFARRYFRNRVSFSSSGYLDVSVHRVPSCTLCIYVQVLEVCSSGSPHSEIDGSFRICRSPSLIAAYHVFLRLLVPRHPPYALIV